MKWMLPLAILIALGGCAPDPAAVTQEVELRGNVTQLMASSDGTGYVLDMGPDAGLLPLDVGDLLVPVSASGVRVEVPAELDIPDAQQERFAVLNTYVEQTGEGLRVTAFLR